MKQYSKKHFIPQRDKNILTVKTGKFKETICSRAHYGLSYYCSFELHFQLNFNLGTEYHQPIRKEVSI